MREKKILTCAFHKIYREEAVSLPLSNNYLKTYDFGKYFRENLYFVNNCLIKVQI